MRNFTKGALFLALLVPLIAFGQGKQKGNKQIISQEALNRTHSAAEKLDQQLNLESQAIMRARPTSGVTQARTGKTSAVAPIAVGRASNAFTILRGEQNQVWASDEWDMVLFMHRQDITVWGGGGTDNGRYRYDFSIDNGTTFTTDIGTMQTLNTNFGRYPNTTVYTPSTAASPFDNKVLYTGPTNAFPTPGWIGHVAGVSEVTTSNPPANAPTENYIFAQDQTLFPGGLCEGLDGEFWAAEVQYDGSAVTDSMRILKGTWNTTTNDVDWIVYETMFIPYDKTADGTIGFTGPNMAFSQDGMNGYLAFLGNLTGGTGTNNGNLNPCFIPTTDGGATWGAPIEADIDAIPWIADSLQTLWITVDSISGDTTPASSGDATCAFDFDVAVDGNGNPHLAVVIGTAADGTAFSISSGLAKFVADIWSPDGGASWNAKYIAPSLAFRGDFGTGDPISMDNFVQIATDEAGDRIFISWSDSDTAAVTGNMNGIGFGVVDQLAPNLRIASWRVTDGFQTCPQLVTDEDFIWEGRALYGTMAPTVLSTGGGEYKMPIVALEMITNDPINPCQFHYFGNDCVINDADYKDPLSLGLDWDNILTGCTAFVSNEDEIGSSNIQLFQSYPNPTTGDANIMFELPAAMEVSLDLVNIYGQQVAVIMDGEMGAGMHEAVVNTNELAAGIYFYNLKANGEVITKRMVVSK